MTHAVWIYISHVFDTQYNILPFVTPLHNSIDFEKKLIEKTVTAAAK